MQTESSIDDPTMMAVHLSWSTHEREKWCTSREHKMADLWWSRPHTMQPGTFISEVVQLSVSCRTGIRAECGVYLASRPTSHNTNHLFHDAGLWYKGATVQTVPWLGRASSSVTRRSKGIVVDQRQSPGATLLKFSRFNTQFAAVVMEVLCAEMGSLSGKAHFGKAGEDLHGLDSIEWYGMDGLECKGGGEDVITYEKKRRWLQLLKVFNCTVTGTWTNNDDNRECHTWRAWGSWVFKKQLDYRVFRWLGLFPTHDWDLWNGTPRVKKRIFAVWDRTFDRKRRQIPCEV